VQLDFPFEVRQDDFRVTAKFPENLPASSTGGRERISVGYDSDRIESALAFGNGLENCEALSVRP
jgi:hypothetical protein